MVANEGGPRTDARRCWRHRVHPVVRAWVTATVAVTVVAAIVLVTPDLAYGVDSGHQTAAGRAGGSSAGPAAGRTSAMVQSVSVSGDIGVSDGHLTLDGSTYQFTGVNAYELATEWGTNAGCGGMLSDAQLDQFFASLRPNSLVRIWALQGSMATDVVTHQIDWQPLDRVFAAATAYHQRLIVSMAGQGGTCDGQHWQDPSWYDGGFMQVFNSSSNSDGDGLDPLSYWQYMQDLVNRYKSSPALGMWEPFSEAEASTCPVQYEPTNCSGHQTCPDEATAAAALRHFFDVVGVEIHGLDPDHLVESGLLGGGQCGTSGSDYEYVQASPGIDVLSYHDYYSPTAPLGGDQWNGLSVRFAQAASLHKPIIAGEVGIEAGPGTGCVSQNGRVNDTEAKLRAQFAAGSSGELLWDWVPSSSSPCSYDIAPGDPVLGLLSSYPL